MRAFACFITFLILSTSLLAQPGNRFSVDDKKAIKLYAEAEQNYAIGLSNEADDLLNKALSREPKFGEALILKAQIQQDKGNTEEAINLLTQTVDISPSKFHGVAYFLADLELREGEYDNAKQHYELFLKFSRDSHPNRDRAHVGIASCDFAAVAKANPVPFNPINLGPGVNSEEAEYFPGITADGNSLLYTRLVKTNGVYSGFQEDFYISSKADEKWGEGLAVRDINTVQNEGAPSLSADGQVLIFTACESIDGWGDYQGKGSCDLFFTRRQGKRWIKPENLGIVNSYKWESQPSFSADGKTLYFVQGTMTGRGMESQDIFVSQLGDNGWSKPEKIKGFVNTDMEEESVMIHPDGKTLYFASNGHPGMGGLDLFVSKLQDDGTWGTPRNLGYPINTGGDENSILVGPDGQLAMFASNREGGFGDLDLYSFELPKEVAAEAVSYVKGTVMDSLSFKFLDARFELIDTQAGELAVESYSNSGDGSFLVCLPPGKNYALNVDKPGYLFYSKSFQLAEGLSEPLEMEVLLQKIKPGASIVLENVFFDTDSYELKPSSKAELLKLVEWMKNNPQVTIEIGGHTDDVGSDQDNLVLSQKRAESVVAFVVNAGIDQSRMVAKGYGETTPK
ncbi:MAG: PD40 domain-containing protein, partial [Flavobacteriales bacterium]|nr:PD40 domain-containing protein [Flavobacteriales bacterium]